MNGKSQFIENGNDIDTDYDCIYADLYNSTNDQDPQKREKAARWNGNTKT